MRLLRYLADPKLKMIPCPFTDAAESFFPIARPVTWNSFSVAPGTH